MAPTRRHLDALECTTRLSKTRDKDLKLFKLMNDAYAPIGAEKKVLADMREGELARLGDGSKVVGGRTPGLDDDAADDAFKSVEDMMMRNSIEPFLAKVPHRVDTSKLCTEVIEIGSSYNKRRKDEHHFYHDLPKKIAGGN